ncbi:MAG: serine/threonine-protein kinase [bacterium]|nr:serine/threonine-protein kinase [bacterium]
MMVTTKTTSTAIHFLPKWVWRMGIAYMLTALITYIFAFPIRYMQLLNNPALTPLMATIQLGIDYLLIIALTIIGFIVVFRRKDEWITLLMACALIAVPPNIGNGSHLAGQLHPILHIPAGIVTITTASLAFLLLISLPDGIAKPRKLLWFIPVLMIYDFSRYLLLIVFPPTNALTLRPLAIIPNFIIVGIALIAMIYRYRNVTSTTQRQQFKWLFWGLTIEISIVFINQIFRVISILMGGNIAITQLIISFSNTIGGILLCTSLVFAISRYGLWDIDLTINRSVVTGFVTISLLMLFGVVFWLVQSMLRGVLGSEQSEISVAISALVVGGAFNPVRQRIRTFVDRRLYGFRFDLNQLQRHQAKLNAGNIGSFTGQTMGGYQLLDVIGRGNMGEVYKGIGNNNKIVAIKIMQNHSSQDERTLHQRFEREGKIVLAHANIVQTLNAGEENGVFYIVMEYIHGVTLKELLMEREHLPLRDILGYLRDLAGAIDYAHAQGYVHRDIKPSNIMLRRDGTNQPRQIMLMDFGIAKFLGDTGTLTGSDAVGTIDYMAPEQIMNSTTVDYRADIYALGVVLYHVLAGVLPFKGTLAQVLFAHINQPAPDIRQIRPDIPLEVSIAIQRALQKDPNDRFQSATEFVQALTSGL